MKKNEDTFEANFPERYHSIHRILRSLIIIFGLSFFIFLRFYSDGLSVETIINTSLIPLSIIIVANLIIYYVSYSLYNLRHAKKIKLENVGFYTWKLNDTKELIRWDSIHEIKDQTFFGEKIKCFIYQPEKHLLKGFINYTNFIYLPIEIGNTVISKYYKQKSDN